MKKLLLFVAFLAFAGVSAQAQCAKSCTKAAATAASMDASIVSKTCEKSGLVSYQKRAVCENSGKVSYTDVKFDSAKKTFVNASPTQVMNDAKAKSCCKEGCAKDCCLGKDASASATAVKASSAEKKAGCCKSGAKSCSKTAAKEAKSTVKAVKASMKENS